jgi:hypothetical protein
MNPRAFTLAAALVAAVAGVVLAASIPGLRAAWRMREFPFHDGYVTDRFGLPWWMVPTGLMLVSVSLFLWGRRSGRRINGAGQAASGKAAIVLGSDPGTKGPESLR